MSEQSEMRDLVSAWKNQPEEVPVKLESFVDRRTGELHAATRSEMLMSIAAALFFVAVVGWRFSSDQGHVPQLGLIAAAVWAFVSMWLFRDRIRREGPGRKDALAATCLEYYRKELERRRDHLRNAWLWHGPLLLACLFLVTILVGKAQPVFRGFARVLPLVVALAVWIGFGLLRRLRQASAIQREIDDINRSE